MLDRTNGKSLISEAFVPANWVKGYDDRGQPIPDPDKEPKPDGVLVTGGVGTNWQAPSYDPDTRPVLRQLARSDGRLLSDDARKIRRRLGRPRFLPFVKIDAQSHRRANRQDPLDGRHRGRGGQSGILSTAGHLVFTADSSSSLVALDDATGKILWHTYPGGSLGTGPMTYELDGRQYVVYAVDGVVYGFALPLSIAGAAPPAPACSIAP